MTILTVGDVCGEIGLRMAESNLRSLRERTGADLCVVNGENADVLGLRPDQAWRLYDAGADAVTLGNHLYNRMQILPELKDSPFLTRPLNLGAHVPGPGLRFFDIDGVRLCLVNLIGRFNCEWNADSPFTALEQVLNDEEADMYIAEIHAEATSEKAALAHAFDGRVAAVYGTHTHVQTSDERILPGGTGFITDLGMTGAHHSILGVQPEQSVARFLGYPPRHYRAPDTGMAKLEGAVFHLDHNRCVSVERVRIEEDFR